MIVRAGEWCHTFEESGREPASALTNSVSTQQPGGGGGVVSSLDCSGGGGCVNERVGHSTTCVLNFRYNKQNQRENTKSS